MHEEQQESDDLAFHASSHKAYRAACKYVDASLRDSGHKPQTVRKEYPLQYATAVRSVLKHLRVRG